MKNVNEDAAEAAGSQARNGSVVAFVARALYVAQHGDDEHANHSHKCADCMYAARRALKKFPLLGTLPELLRALEPFADVDGEGDEDFGDDTPVVVTFGRTRFYAIKLGDFRRARAAHASASERATEGSTTP